LALLWGRLASEQTIRTHHEGMHPMKRLIAAALLLSTFSVIGFVGCGDEGAKPATPPAGGTPTPTPAPAPGGDAPKDAPK
jgi:hypothetical protein